jgi:hypothetical protein
MKISSRTFVGDLERPSHSERRPSSVADRVDAETRERLERLRRGE